MEQEEQTQALIQLLSDKDIYGIYGIVIGAALTAFTFWFLNKQNYRLKLWEKLIDKRIKAHEEVINAAKLMQCVKPLGGVNENGKLKRIPIVLNSVNEFHDFFVNFTSLTQMNSCWLSTKTKREVNFVQDYLVNVNQAIEGLSNDKLEEFGWVVHYDFITIADALEKSAHKFFRKEIMQFKAGNLSEWHKMSDDETIKRLHDTNLFKKVILPKNN